LADNIVPCWFDQALASNFSLFVEGGASEVSIGCCNGNYSFDADGNAIPGYCFNVTFTPHKVREFSSVALHPTL